MAISFIHSELYQSKVWNEDPKYWSPMIILDNKKHAYVGDIVTSKSTCKSWTCGKVIKFVEVLHNLAIVVFMVKVH